MQRVIITGASSGIGTALAHQFAQHGATLGLIARRKTELESLAGRLSVPVQIYPADVRDAAAMQAAAADFIAHHGCPDIVIANAGVSTGTLTEFAEDLVPFQGVIDVNLMGMVKTFQPFVAAMREAGQGKLVGIASVAGYRGLPGAAAYSASKAAVISYLESLRIELAASGVRVITICPGYIETPLTAGNPYPMPFLMNVETAARKIVTIIERGKSFTVIPWQMAVVARLMYVMPRWLYDWALSGAPRKPRRR